MTATQSQSVFVITLNLKQLRTLVCGIIRTGHLGTEVRPLEFIRLSIQKFAHSFFEKIAEIWLLPHTGVLDA